MKTSGIPRLNLPKRFVFCAISALALLSASLLRAGTPQSIDPLSFNPGEARQVGDTYKVFALSSSSLPVTFVSSDTNVAVIEPTDFSGTGYELPATAALVRVVGYGVSTITASQPGDATYDAALPLLQQLTVGDFGVVSYSPFSGNAEGGMPRKDIYTVRVSRPGNANSAQPISFSVSVRPDDNGNYPLGSKALAESFVYVTRSSATLDAGAAYEDVVITCDIPGNLNIPPGTSLSFVYKVFTSGWVADNPGGVIVDNGFALNATVTVPPVSGNAPPVILISEPSLPVYGPYAAGVAATVPLAFQVVTASTNTIDSVQAVMGPNRIRIPIAESEITGLKTSTVSVVSQVPITGAGTYTLYLSGSDSGGRSTESTVTFTVLADNSTVPPVVTITSPAPAEVFTRVYGSNPWTIPFTFTAGTPSGVITGVSAMLDGGSIGVATSGLSTDALSGSANLNLNTAGLHTISVTATNSLGGSATATGTFTIVTTQATPAIVWNNPASITLGTPLSATQLNAYVTGGVPGTLAYNPDTGTVLPLGPNTLSVTFTPVDKDNYSPVTKTVQILVTGAPSTITVSGVVYLDINENKRRDNGEPGLGLIPVQLYKSGVKVGVPVATNADGSFAFPDLALAPSGTYSVDAIEPAGLTPTDSDARVVMSADGKVRDIGLAFRFSVLATLKGEGMSQGYWKMNLEKTTPANPKGTQEKNADLVKYTTQIKTLALSTFSEVNGMSDALKIFSGSDQLRLQLLASEYNFLSGRLVNGSIPLTYAFIVWGESVEAGNYTSTYKTFVKNWMDAFNNSHGGLVKGPLSP